MVFLYPSYKIVLKKNKITISNEEKLLAIFLDNKLKFEII